IGGAGSGSFVQTGGTNTTGADSSGLTLGSEAAGAGSYSLENDAQLSANVEIIGDQGTGTFDQTDNSTNTVALGLVLGNVAGGSGTYNLDGGSLSVGNDNEAIGLAGQGTFTQNG